MNHCTAASSTQESSIILESPTISSAISSTSSSVIPTRQFDTDNPLTQLQKQDEVIPIDKETSEDDLWKEYENDDDDDDDDSVDEDMILESEFQPPSSSTAGKYTPVTSGFKTLYCGTVLIVQSYLSMSELLKLARVSKYFRRVAMGVINPSGKSRLGKELPFVAWDVARLKQPKPQDETPMLSKDQCPFAEVFDEGHETPCLVHDLARRIPKFIPFADNLLKRHIKQRKRTDISRLAKTSLEEFIAVIPAPVYGAPVSSRTVSLERLCSRPLEILLLSPIIGRHMQALVTSGWLRLSDATISVLTLRFPCLRSVSFSLRDPNLACVSMSWRSFTNRLRLPSRLTSLTLSCKTHDEVTLFLSLLPSQCPQLQEICFTITSQDKEEVQRIIDFSPLLQLGHLTRLTCEYAQNGLVQHSPIISKLAHLKFLRLDCWQSELESCIPFGNQLEEFRSQFDYNEEGFRLLAQRAPQLRKLQLGEVHSFFRSGVVDISFLPTFTLLHTLRFHFCADYYDCDSHLSDYGQKCMNRFGSINAHIEYVVDILRKLRSLTNISLESLQSPTFSRSVLVNADYFATRKFNYERYTALFVDETVEVASEPYRFFGRTNKAVGYRFPVVSKKTVSSSAHSDASLSPYHPFSSNLKRNSVYQVSVRLPQLTKLSISSHTSMDLPSLSFLAHLPHLQSLELIHATYLPIESLYDLRFVSSTLTSLRINSCFPSISSHPSPYLLHDVLQPLQLSFPVTRVATIYFPQSMRRSAADEDDYDEQASSSRVVVPTLSFSDGKSLSESTFNNHPSLSASLASSTPVDPSIPPRHSSWYSIIRLPPAPKLDSLTLLDVLKEIDPEATEETMDNHPERTLAAYRLQHRKGRVSQMEPYREIFDCFTTRTELKDSTTRIDAAAPLLAMKLLPHLAYCEITHQEPNQQGVEFVYDRLQVPRHRFHVERPKPHVEANERLRLAEKRHRMMSIYGLHLDDSMIDEISYGREYSLFLLG